VKKIFKFDLMEADIDHDKYCLAVYVLDVPSELRGASRQILYFSVRK
jgi:hypothetical protein